MMEESGIEQRHLGPLHRIPGALLLLLSSPSSFRYVQLSNISGFEESQGTVIFSQSLNKSLETYLRDTVSSVSNHCNKASPLVLFPGAYRNYDCTIL